MLPDEIEGGVALAQRLEAQTLGTPVDRSRRLYDSQISPPCQGRLIRAPEFLIFDATEYAHPSLDAEFGSVRPHFFSVAE
jgi:hypothetical protein